MSKNPFLNATVALGYIFGVVSVLHFFFESIPESDAAAPVFPMVFVLSLFSLSVAVMAYLFFYQPVILFRDGEKVEATKLFIQTLLCFGGLIVVLGLLVASLFF